MIKVGQSDRRNLLPPTTVPGGELIDKKGDLKMVCRSIRERWPISDHRREVIIDRLFELLTDPASDSKTRIQAAKALADLDRINASREAAIDGMTLEEIKDLLRERLIEKLGPQEQHRLSQNAAGVPTQ